MFLDCVFFCAVRCISPFTSLLGRAAAFLKLFVLRRVSNLLVVRGCRFVALAVFFQALALAGWVGLLLFVK